MTEILKEAIIIGSTEVGEKDKMIRAISSDGYFSFYAKGVASITSKNSSSLTTFSKSNLTLFIRPNGTYLLKTGILEKQYYSISNYEEMAICSLMEELSKLFINETTNSDVYNALEDSLKKLSNDPLLAGLEYFFYLLNKEGILPNEYTNILANLNSLEKNGKISALNQLISYIESSLNIVLRSKDLIKLI